MRQRRGSTRLEPKGRAMGGILRSASLETTVRIAAGFCRVLPVLSEEAKCYAPLRWNQVVDTTAPC